MTIVPDITLQFLKWRFRAQNGAQRAFSWISEDIERLGWHGWLTAKDELLMAERERLFRESNDCRVDQLHSQISTLEILVEQGIQLDPHAWNRLRMCTSNLVRYNEQLAASLFVYSNMRNSLTFLTHLSKRKRA